MLAFPAAAFATNCYVIAPGPGEECLVVDPGIGVLDTLHDIFAEHRLRPAAVLLTLLSLGITGIKLGPTLPAFLTPALVDVLVEKFQIAPIGEPAADLEAALGECKGQLAKMGSCMGGKCQGKNPLEGEGGQGEWAEGESNKSGSGSGGRSTAILSSHTSSIFTRRSCKSARKLIQLALVW